MKLPDLGVGMVQLPGLGPLLGQLTTPLDVVEIEPQAFWSHASEEYSFRTNLDRMEQAVAGRGNVLVHSVGYPIAGCIDGDARQLPALRDTFALLKPAWWSEHASFVWVGTGLERRHLGFLMPPVQSLESVRVIADRIKRIQDLFGLPFAFETGVNYLRPVAGELPDGRFWGEIAVEADCGLLLDLHNVWTNAANGRQPLDALFAELPLDRVWEIHMAGGQSHRGYWLDSHSGLPMPVLVDAAAEVIPRLTNLHAVILEIIPDYIPANDISAGDVSECLWVLRRLWDGRGRQSSGPRPAPRRPTVSSGSVNLPSMRVWGESLERALDSSNGGPTTLFEDDPGLQIYRDLIATARRGMIVEALPLSLRYLLNALDEDELGALFQRFWSTKAVQPFISDEAVSFSDYVRREVRLPHLAEVLNFELAAHQVAINNEPASVRFTCEPEALFNSISAGTAPDVRPCLVSLEITAPTLAAGPAVPPTQLETIDTAAAVTPMEDKASGLKLRHHVTLPARVAP